MISEEHFNAVPPLGIVLPLAVKDSTSEEVEYMIEELHTSGRWNVLVYNVNHNMKGITYSETSKHGTYIILISGT